MKRSYLTCTWKARCFISNRCNFHSYNKRCSPPAILNWPKMNINRFGADKTKNQFGIALFTCAKADAVQLSHIKWRRKIAPSHRQTVNKYVYVNVNQSALCKPNHFFCFSFFEPIFLVRLVDFVIVRFSLDNKAKIFHKLYLNLSV